MPDSVVENVTKAMEILNRSPQGHDERQANATEAQAYATPSPSSPGSGPSRNAIREASLAQS